MRIMLSARRTQVGTCCCCSERARHRRDLYSSCGPTPTMHPPSWFGVGSFSLFLVVARPQVSSAATAAIAGTDSNVVTKIESRASTSARP